MVVDEYRHEGRLKLIETIATGFHYLIVGGVVINLVRLIIVVLYKLNNVGWVGHKKGLLAVGLLLLDESFTGLFRHHATQALLHAPAEDVLLHLLIHIEPFFLPFVHDVLVGLGHLIEEPW